MSDRVDELTLLRPIDFLAPLSHDRPMVNPTVSSGDDSRDSSYQPKKLSAADKLVDMWTEQSRRLQTFWNMRHEMVLLGSVERGPRPDKTTSNRRPQGQVVPNLIGQYVLVKDDSTPQYKWKRAEILDLIASSDGVIRTASIRLPSRSISRRAIYHLYPIEVELKELRPPYSIFVLKQHPRKRSSGQWKTKSSARSGTTTPTSQVHHTASDLGSRKRAKDRPSKKSNTEIPNELLRRMISLYLESASDSGRDQYQKNQTQISQTCNRHGARD
ncbi:Integrase core domain containing protein [Aphelenchoides avenae]|nr:Integrase core domain containing protein [Aphelenchus avenae]